MPTKTYHSGNYKLKRPEKYLGDPDKVRFLSSWEEHMCLFCDSNPNVLKWSTNSFAVPYEKPIFQNGKMHKETRKYYPDFFMEVLSKSNTVKKYIIEIKPDKETRPSKSRNAKVRLNEQMVFAVNTAKWTACKRICQANGFEFIILTEKQLFSMFPALNR